MMERIKQDAEEEKKRIFQSDKRAYFMMKEDIKQGYLKEEKISVLFKQKYPVFKFMEENGDLDSDNEYDIYCSLFDELYKDEHEQLEEKHYVPHNYHYLPESEKEKYKKFVEKQKPIKIPSYDEILMEYNEIQKQELINNSGVVRDEDTTKMTTQTDENVQLKGVSSLDQIKKIFENNFSDN